MEQHLPKAIYYILLSMIPGLGPKRIKSLVAFYKSVEAIFEGNPEDLETLTKVKKEGWSALLHDTILLDKAKKEFEETQTKGISLFSWDDDGYPVVFHELYDPPPLIYIKGVLKPEDVNAISIIGTRTPTEWSKGRAYMMARELAIEGLTIVSGLARGIDGVAHQGAISGGGRTIGILGCGVEVVYPKEHQRLYQEIAENGVLLSEFSLHAPPERFHFPLRNRLIAILSVGVLLIEGGEDSGALITLKQALEYGRQIFALPGPSSDKRFAGNNNLIRQGAFLVESSYHIIEDLIGVLDLNYIKKNHPKTQLDLPEYRDYPEKPLKPMIDPKKVDTANNPIEMNPVVRNRNDSVSPSLLAQEMSSCSPSELNLLSQLSITKKLHIDELVALMSLPSKNIVTLLMELELKGLVVRSPGNFYVKK